MRLVLHRRIIDRSCNLDVEIVIDEWLLHAARLLVRGYVAQQMIRSLRRLLLINSSLQVFEIISLRIRRLLSINVSLVRREKFSCWLIGLILRQSLISLGDFNQFDLILFHIQLLTKISARWVWNIADFLRYRFVHDFDWHLLLGFLDWCVLLPYSLALQYVELDWIDLDLLGLLVLLLACLWICDARGLNSLSCDWFFCGLFCAQDLLISRLEDFWRLLLINCVEVKLSWFVDLRWLL